MPITIVKVSPMRYQVVNLETGHIYSKKTTLKKAQKQLRLLNMIIQNEKNRLTS